MSKTIITRIKNKVDSLSAWQSSTVPLLNGEIAIVRVPTGQNYTNPVTGKSEPVVELLMKVGDGSTAFNALPWLSAKASDVYNWAKLSSAYDIELSVDVDGTVQKKKLGDWLKAINDNANDSAADVAELSAKVDVDKVSTAITAAINALDSTTSGSGNFVKSVVQTDGKVAVTYGNIAEADLPSISAGKIIVDDKNTTLTSKLATQDAAIAANTAKLAGHTDAAINTLIDNKINALDVADSGTGYVTKVTQTNGKIEVTKSALPTAGTDAAGIVKLGATGGAATFEAVSTLSEQVETNTTDIADLKTSVAGGVHFVGVTTGLTDGATTKPITVDGKSHNQSAGDVVLCGDKEFIWSGSAWKELGDLSRVGTLETWRDGLDVTDTAVTNKFVTAVSQADGKISVSRAQPTVSDIKYDDANTLAAFLASHIANYNTLNGKVDVEKVSTAIANAINALDVNDPTASGTATSFISTVKQTDGKIVATKANLPTASSTVAGIVKLGADGGAAPYSVVADVSAIEGNYMRFNSTDSKMYIGESGTEDVIFDCGGAN